MTYGKHELDAVRKFSYGAWLLLAKPLNILHLCMEEDIYTQPDSEQFRSENPLENVPKFRVHNLTP
jgi:hypothetical protein